MRACVSACVATYVREPVYMCVYGCISRAKSAALVPRVGRTTDGPALGLTSRRPSPALPVASWWGRRGEACARFPPRRSTRRCSHHRPRAPSNATHACQGWDQVQCVLVNLNQFDKYSGRKKVFVYREAFDFRCYSTYVCDGKLIASCRANVGT